MTKVIKRSEEIVSFDETKIIIAIKKSMEDTIENNGVVYEDEAIRIASEIKQEIAEYESPIHVEEIQDIVEYKLMSAPDKAIKNVAKHYILFRFFKNEERRTKVTKARLLTDEFISNYKKLKPPFTDLGHFVYSRTYSRWLAELQRREHWWETVRRAIEYNCSLVDCGKDEAEELFHNVFNLKQFLSGRTFWVGNTYISKHFPMSNYNCAFQMIKRFKDFRDLFYLLMIGSGVGLRLSFDEVDMLPSVRADVKLDNIHYFGKPKDDRLESTELTFSKKSKSTAIITIGDSKEGWVQSLDFYLQLISRNEYRHIDTIQIIYDNVRPKGEKLKTFGGTASGYESLLNMFVKIDRVLKNYHKSKVKLKPIDCLDIANIIGENVVVGGVRRTAEILLLDSEDRQSIEAKNDLYTFDDGKWNLDNTISHRQMSNNSIYYTEKPSREQLHWQIEQMRYSGEPAWVNAEAASKRRDNFNGVNPCGEILLDNKGLCNLTTINVFAFVDSDGNLDRDGLGKAQRLSARAGYRMTCVELELPEWDFIQKRDKLVGCSLTGWQDMVNATGMNKGEEAELLKWLRQIAHTTIEEYAEQLGMNKSILITTVKPEGTLSQLPTVSSGVHYSHSPYYVRRVRINAHDPLVSVIKDLEYPIYPEVGQEMDSATTLVVEFPVKAPKGKTKYDVSAIEQLENYLMFQENYTDHNTSITVHVRNNEWQEVEQFVWDNWDRIVAVSFLALDDSFYELLPYEAIDEEEYNRRVSEMNPFNPLLLQQYEKEEIELDFDSSSCENGFCPVK